jgi:hypothetical protein
MVHVVLISLASKGDRELMPSSNRLCSYTHKSLVIDVACGVGYIGIPFLSTSDGCLQLE